MMGDDLFKLDNEVLGVDTGDATDDDKPLEDEPQNECTCQDDDSKQLSQNAEDDVPVFDELDEDHLMGQLFAENPLELAHYAENHVPKYDDHDEDHLMGQLFAENPLELAHYAENHVPKYDDHDYHADRLQKIRFTLAHSQRYAAHGLDMLAHAMLLLTELRTAAESDHVSEAHLEGIIQWSDQMGAYAEVLDDYCDEVHEFALYLIDFELEGPMFARHAQLETVADHLLRDQRDMRALVTAEREYMQRRQARYEESQKFLHPDRYNVEAEQQVNSAQDVKAESAEEQVNVQGNGGEANAVEKQNIQD